MNEKHLYAVDLTADKKNTRIDETPYTTAVLSGALREQREASSKVLQKQLFKSLGLVPMLTGYICAGLGLFILLESLSSLREQTLAELLHHAAWLLAVGAVLLIGGVWLILRTRRKQKKLTEAGDLDVELNASIDHLGNIGESAAFELGVPGDDEVTELEVLAFRYKTTDKGVREVRENKVYENETVFIWRDGDTLGLSDYDSVLRIPLAELVGYRTVEETIILSFWYKDDPHDAEPWLAYDIKETNEFNYRIKGYHEILIRHAATETDYILAIPAYDLEALLQVVALEKIGD